MGKNFKKKLYLLPRMVAAWFKSLRDDVTPGSVFAAHQFQVVGEKNTIGQKKVGAGQC